MEINKKNDYPLIVTYPSKSFIINEDGKIISENNEPYFKDTDINYSESNNFNKISIIKKFVDAILDPSYIKNLHPLSADKAGILQSWEKYVQHCSSHVDSHSNKPESV